MAALRLLQAPESSIVGALFWDLFPRASQQDLQNAMARSGEVVLAQSVSVGGGARPVCLEARLARRTPGSYSVWLSRKQAEPIPSEMTFLRALQSAGLGAWQLELLDEKLTWSERTRSILGVEPSAPIDHELFFSRVHPEDRERVRSASRKTFFDPTEYYDCEFRVVWPDGSIHWVHSWGRTFFGSDGRALCLEGVIANIDQRKLQEERIKRDEETLQAIIDRSPAAISVVDGRGCVSIWNPAAEQILGYEAGQIVGEKLPFAIDLSAEGQSRDYRVLRRDGREIEISCTFAPLRRHVPAEQHCGHIVLFSDNTERMMLNRRMEQTQRLESLGVLAGGVAHDFNNLLTGMLGNASLGLLLLEEANEVRPLLQDILSAGERAANLTKQLLAYAGKSPFVPSSVDLGDLASKMVSLIRASLQNPLVQVVLRTDPALPAIRGDANQLQQALLSLIMNGAEAIQENSAGVVSIEVRRAQVSPSVAETWEGGVVPQPGHYLILEVRDTGSGMDEGTRARAFEPFFSTKFTGRGLGLSAVLGIVRQHGGGLSVVSQPGQGSNFRVYLPALQPTKTRFKKPSSTREDLEGAGLILVVDDEEMVRNTIRRTLERLHYRVVMAENGQAAVEAFPSLARTLRAVILDLTMPVMGGVETLEHLRRVRADLPVILTSGYTESEALRRMKHRGISAFLQKPFSNDELGRKLREALDGSRMPNNSSALDSER